MRISGLSLLIQPINQPIPGEGKQAEHKGRWCSLNPCSSWQGPGGNLGCTGSVLQSDTRSCNGQNCPGDSSGCRAGGRRGYSSWMGPHPSDNAHLCYSSLDCRQNVTDRNIRLYNVIIVIHILVLLHHWFCNCLYWLSDQCARLMHTCIIDLRVLGVGLSSSSDDILFQNMTEL